jgi:hypothetical protein
MAVNGFQNSAEPTMVYKILVGAFVGIVGTRMGKWV